MTPADTPEDALVAALRDSLSRPPTFVVPLDITTYLRQAENDLDGAHS